METISNFITIPFHQQFLKIIEMSTKSRKYYITYINILHNDYFNLFYLWNGEGFLMVTLRTQNLKMK